MRFVWAVVAFVLAAVMIGAGIAQRTVFQGPKSVTSEVSVRDEAPYLLIDGAILGSMPGTQTLRAQADGDVFAAYGRTADIKAWLADTEYSQVRMNNAGDLSTVLVKPKAPADAPAGTLTPEPAEESAADAADDAAAAEGDEASEAPARSPMGSDLWLDEFQQSKVLIAPLQLPEDMSVLVATDGQAPAPTAVSVSWPIGNGTPWAGPLIVAGGLLMAVGVLLYILGIRHARRSRGPRRKGLPVPVTEPIDLAVEGEAKGVISSGAPTRRSLESGRRALAIVPAVAVSALLFTGCSADAWPQFGPTPTPSPTATVIVPEGQQTPAVTKPQAERILARIAQTVAEADEARDADLAATRLEGAALAVRSTNYTLRGEIADHPTLDPVLSKNLQMVVPQAYDEWPRSVLAIADDEQSKTSSIMLMTQADPWAPYKLSYTASLEASTEIPDLNPVYVGATQIPPDSSFLLLAPDELAAAYADVLDNGDESEFSEIFDAETDQFRVSIAADRQNRLDAFNETAAETGAITFATQAGEQPPFALATVESGAIVAVNLDEVETVKSTNEDAVIKVDGNPTVKALSGASQGTGFTTTYTDQLFFYVPAQGSSEKIRLLGYNSELLKAEVIK